MSRSLFLYILHSSIISIDNQIIHVNKGKYQTLRVMLRIKLWDNLYAIHNFKLEFSFFLQRCPIIFFLFMAIPAVYGSYWASDQIEAEDANLCHSHGNNGPEPHLQPTKQLVATPDP